MGGATVLLAANSYSEKYSSSANYFPISAIVTDSAFSEFESAVSGWLKHKLPFLKTMDKLFSSLFFLSTIFIPNFWSEDNIQPCDAIKQLNHIPILIVHGTGDTLVSIDEAHKLIACFNENIVETVSSLPKIKRLLNCHIFILNPYLSS